MSDIITYLGWGGGVHPVPPPPPLPPVVTGLSQLLSYSSIMSLAHTAANNKFKHYLAIYGLAYNNAKEYYYMKV